MTLSRRDLLITAAAALPGSLLRCHAGAAATPGSLAAAESGARWSLPPERGYKTVENEWIVLEDGTRLAARLWIPEGRAGDRAPVVLEYLPYRKRDVTRRQNDATGHYLAAHGIAYARVDIRGSGDSDGLLMGEYTPQEQTDGVQVIAWLAAQRWCNGAVGMRGISWGGFNSLQIAALAPPQLKAIMPACFTDNQFTDDAHYYGATLSNPNDYWGVMFQSVLGAAPDPQIVGDRWREMWMKRLEALPPIHAQWIRHQRFDAHWKAGSVCVDYGRVRCPVYAVGGLNDHYVNANARLMQHLTVPRKSIIGPWAHDWPDSADPGPSLDWVAEEVRWWYHWLHGVDTGIMDEPAFRVYLCEKTAVEVYPDDVPGRWIAEQSWPSPNIEPKTLYLSAAGALSEAAGERKQVSYRGDRIVGMLRGEPDAFFFPMDLPQEQTADDERSLLFDSAPLSTDLQVVGNPILKVRVSADVPVARIAVRLTQVTPEGKSWAFTMGMLNLTHRESHEHPAPLEPGRDYDVEVPITFTSTLLKAGNRLRVALSESFWPLTWPSPRIATLTFTTGISCLVLPVRAPRPAADAPHVEVLRDRVRDKQLINRRGGLEVHRSGPDEKGWARVEKSFAPRESEAPDVGTVVTRGWTPQLMQMREGAPESCKWQGGFTTSYRRADWNTAIHGGFELTSTAGTFRVKEFVRAMEGDKTVFERHWEHSIKRDLM